MRDGDSESRSFWEVLGGLKANVEQLIMGQQRLEQGLKETNERLERGLKENNDRIDRGLKENSDRTDRGLKENSDRTDQGLKETNERIDRKFDRLLYAVIALGGGVVAILVMLVLD